MIIERVASAASSALSKRRISRTVVVALFATLIQIISGSFTPASAAGTPVVTVPANGWVIAQSATTTLSGVSVSGLGASDTYLITVALNGSYTGSTLKIGTTTNLVASYGYSSSTFNSFTKVSFTGIAADINTALATLQYIAGTAQVSGTTPSISISAVENISGLAFNSYNNHYYKAYQYGTSGVVVGTDITDRKQSTALTWAGTKTFAGLTGYLVTITSSGEDSFVSATIPSAQNIWIGAKDNWTGGGYTFGEGYWGWASPGSPEYGAGFSYDSTASSGVTINATTGRYVSTGRTVTASYTSANAAITMTGANGGSSNGYYNWCSNEPNNAYGSVGEHSAVTNWSGGTCWNDLHEDNNTSVSGFVVEWGTSAADGGFTNAVTSSAKVYLAPTISRVSGNNQIAKTSTGLPTSLKAVIKDSMGTVIPGATLSWAATSGTVSAATSISDATGNANLTTWTMPASVGYDTLTASYGGAGNPSITFSAYATAFPFSNGETDSAISLNGGTQYAVASGLTVLPTAWNSPFTFEAWVNPSSAGNGAVIFSQGSGSNRFYIKRYLGQLIWYRDGWNLGSEQNCGYFPTNDWTHVALTWDGTSSAKCYLNGALTLSSAGSNQNTTTLSTPTVIGQYSAIVGEANSYFAGQIDEVKIWDSARSAANIGVDLSTHTDTSTAGLLAYYDFNEGAGSRIYNLIRSSSSATAPVDFTTVNSPAWDSSLIQTITTSAPYTTVTFKRSLLITSGGWLVPAGVSNVSTLVVAGGGAGGSRVGGGGGAGGYVYRGSTMLSAGLRETITVGAGGVGVANFAGKNGGNSLLGLRFTAIGGGGGGASNGNGERTGRAGGSGGGSGDTGASYGSSTQNSTGSTGLGNRGASGQGGGNWSAGGGGGANAVGFDGTDGTYPGAGGTGQLESITGTAICYAAGGGGGIYDSGTGTRSNGGSCGGAYITGGSGAKGALTGYVATANTGSGGGGAGYNDAATGGTADLPGGSGGSGVIVIRWITATKPIFTQPASDTLTAGMFETFTVSNNPLSPLIRNFRWQSSTDTGTTWADLAAGSGFRTQTYSTPTLETTTSGIRYQYRVIVTDSDTAGLFIIDTSTAVYLIINPRIVITGSYTIQKYGATHVDTFTTVAGTGTGTETFTFSPNNRTGITWNGSTPNQATLTIARTLGPGTYYETMTATDTKGAFTQLGIAIVVSKADTITVTSLGRTDTFTASALTFSPGYTVSGLQNSDTVTSISWSYSGTDNSSTAYGPSATKPINAGSYTITPSAAISNSDSYTAVVFTTSTLTVNRATRTLSASISPSPLKFGATATISATPSAGSGDGTLTYANANTDSCTVTAANVQAIKSSGSCGITAVIARGNNYETATATTVNLTLAKADTLTVSVNAITPVTYTGSPAAVSPTVTVTGLALTNSVGASPTTISYVSQGVVGSTCAQGGACAIGDTGPGGGIVFYDAGSQQSWGRYLEAAPANWSGGADNQASNVSKWCEATSSVDGTIFGGLANGYGFGYTNTYDSRLNVCTGGAIYKARTYRGGGYTNWYLPNATELAVMASASIRTLIGLVNDATKWGYWGSNEDQSTGYIGSLVTSGWGIGVTVKGESAKNYTRPIHAFSQGEVATTTFSSPPTDAGTYTVKASSLALTSGSLSDYQGVTYTDGSLLINRAKQLSLVIAQYAATFGLPYKVMVYGGSGTGALTETVTAGTALGCTISGDTVTSTSVGTCNVYATKAQDKNYETATAVAYIYFLTYFINQPVAVSAAASDIALSGATAMTVDTTTPPAITGLSTLTLSLAGGGTFTITGSGFSASGLSVKFWRNKIVVPTGSTATTITFSVSDISASGATSGRISVITVNGQAFSTDTLTITP